MTTYTMNACSIKTIDDRHILGSASVKARVDRQIRNQYNLSQLDLDILLCIGDLSASHATPAVTVPHLVFFTGYSDSNRGKVYNRVERLTCNELPMLEKYNSVPASYSITAHGAKIVRRWLELAKMYKDDIRIYGES